MQARDGELFFIDMSTRVWGNFLSWANAGLDFTEGYFYAIGANSTPPTTKRPQPEHAVAIFPAGEERRRAHRLVDDRHARGLARLQLLRASCRHHLLHTRRDDPLRRTNPPPSNTPTGQPIVSFPEARPGHRV